MEKLFDAYLTPNIYYDKDVGITSDSNKIASYLSSGDPPGAGEPDIKSWHRVEDDYFYYLPCAMVYHTRY